MKNRKLWLTALSLVLTVTLTTGMVANVFPGFSAEASTISELEKQVDDLQAQQDEIDAQIADLESQLSSNLSSMQEVVDQKNLIDQQIFALHQQVANLNDQIATYSLLIADKQVELEAAQTKLNELNAKNKERIRAMEEDGNLSYWSVLFKANDFSDFLDRLNMVQEIAASDQRRLKEMQEAALAVEEAKTALETEKAALEAKKEELAQSQVELEKKRAEADTLLAELVATGEEYERLLDEAEAQSAAIGTDLDAAKDAYDDAKYQQWLSTSVPPTTSAGSSSSSGSSSGGSEPDSTVVNGLTWLTPCNYVLFTSAYGWRVHPVYGDWRFHSGVDLAGSSGTPIVATRSGVVTTASYDWSGGYYVVIDHQDGFASKYLHMTHYIVSSGDYVSAGQVIGYMGSTGTSTGPHLHFSVLYNGNYVNPANYISIG